MGGSKSAKAGPNPLADMDRGGPNPLAHLDRGVEIRGGSKSAVTPSQIAEPTVFQVVLRRLGKSFQSTITASQVNLSDYNNATAQSYFKKVRIVIEWNGYAAAMWGVGEHQNGNSTVSGDTLRR